VRGDNYDFFSFLLFLEGMENEQDQDGSFAAYIKRLPFLRSEAANSRQADGVPIRRSSRY
jgi:hypothetical protein